MIKEHYARAGVPMLPVTRGDAETARADRPVHGRARRGDARAGRVRRRSGSCTASRPRVLGAVFLWLAVELRRTMARAAAVRLFHFSLLYLALLFVAMAIDTVVI